MSLLLHEQHKAAGLSCAMLPHASDSQLLLPEASLLLKNLLDCSGDRRQLHCRSCPLPPPFPRLPGTLGRPCSLQSFPSRDVSNREAELILLRLLLDQATCRADPNYIIFSCQTSFLLGQDVIYVSQEGGF